MMLSGKGRAALTMLSMLAVSACSQLPPSVQHTRPALGPVLSEASHISRPIMRIRTLRSEVLRNLTQLYIEPSNCPAPTWQADRNNTLFVLRNALSQRGYQFTQDRHRAQAVVRLRYRGLVARHHNKPGRALQDSQAIFNRPGSERICQHNGERVLPLPARPDTVYTRLPVIRIELTDPASGQLIWQGEAAGHHRSARPSLNTQLLIVGLSRQLPMQPHQFTGSGSHLGIRYAIASADGEHFRPVITEVIAGSPAAAAGLKVGDPLLSIEHRSVLNRPMTEILPLLLDFAPTRLLSVQRPLGETPILIRKQQLVGMRHSP